MSMNCGMECIKYLLFVFNFIFAICGLAIVTVGVIYHIKVHDISSALGDGFPPSMPIYLIVIGAIIFIIAFFGCCGAIRDSHCMIVTFAVFLLTILVFQVAIAAYAYMQDVNQEKVEGAFRKEVFNKYYSDNASKDIMDVIQSTFSCCGISGQNDYRQQFPSYPIPGTCCGNAADKTCSVYDPKIFDHGCGREISEFFKKTLKVLGGVAIGVAVVELLGIIFSLCLANAIRNDERRGYRV